MARLSLIGGLLIIQFNLCFGQLWFEDFSAEVDGVTTGTAAGTPGGTWSTTYAGAGTFSKQSPFGIELFLIQNTGTEGIWSTNTIDISGTGRAIVDITVAGLFVDGADYIRCYYRVDGGPETQFFEQNGGIATFTLTGTAIVTGSSLQIVVRSSVDGSFFGFDAFSIDDVTVTAINTLYSRKNGNWDDASAGNGTWSVVGLGGASCDCTPLTTDYVIIGNSNTVNINVAATAGGIEVQNTGTLQWTASGIDLNVDRGILQVDAGGSINRNGQTGVQIDFDRGILNTFVNNGTVTAEDIDLTVANITLTISGSGSINLTDDFLVTQDNIEITNDLTGSFVIGDDLIFSEDVCSFINNQTLTITSDISSAANTDDDNVFTNSTGAILNVSGFNPNDADFDIFNSGIVNQSGNFTNISATDTNFDNLAGGVWNWTLTPNTTFDTSMGTVLNCTAVANTFHYSGAGAQRIIPASYHHLTLSNSGAKDANNASFSVAGDWTVTSSASFTEGTGTITLNGTGTQTLTNPSGETFNNLTLNNTSGTSILFNNNVTVTNTLTMTSGIVNLSGNSFTLGTAGSASDLNRTASTTTNWMYGGSFTRFWLSGTAVSSTAGNLYGLFPLGTSAASSYRPFAVTSTSNPTANGSYTVTHVDASGVTDLSPFYNDGGTNIERKVNAQFIATSSGVTGGTYNISATMTGLLPGTLSDIRLAVSNGATTVTNVGTHAAATGTAPNPTAGRTGVSLADLTGDFRITTTNATSTPLPIELISFDVKSVNTGVEIEWVTASELNNDFFTVERGATVEELEAIMEVKGKGTSTKKSFYKLLDPMPLAGQSYYRLKQTDFDGTVTYSELKTIKIETELTLTVTPNPITAGRPMVVMVQGAVEQKSTTIAFELVNSLGLVVHRGELTPQAEAPLSYELTTESLPKGVYFARIGTFPVLTTRVIVN